MGSKQFLDEDFLLDSISAVKLFHDYAEGMPIFDYHCHLPPLEIEEDREYENITEIWLKGDHYKWRAMRTNGVAERYITGDASDRQKFDSWASTVPRTAGNPLYHWTHLELQRYFGITDLLSPDTADRIYDETGKKLQSGDYSVRSLIGKFNVKVLCTTDDPADSLEAHLKMRDSENISTKVLPTFRPDRATAFDEPGRVREYLPVLSEACGFEIRDYDTYLDALKSRHEFFHAAGCRISDHALTVPVCSSPGSSGIDALFKKVLDGRSLDDDEAGRLKTAALLEIGRMNHKAGWTMQLHIGALRNINTRMFKLLGPDSGFDSIADGSIAGALSCFLDSLDVSGELPRTIIYVLNPRDNYVVGTIIGSFQDGSIPGKIQFGSGWWFNDQKEGMERQLGALANLGLLSGFVGMLTDSRSFMSFPRHEYFRRILCNMIGGQIDRGELPSDYDLLGKMVQDISYNNAVRYFGIDRD